jgi:hypothetical protein
MANYWQKLTLTSWRIRIMGKYTILDRIRNVIISMPDTTETPEYTVYEKAKAFDEIAEIVAHSAMYEFLTGPSPELGEKE